MSAKESSVAEAINSFTGPDAELKIYQLPGNDQMALLRMDFDRYIEEMDVIFERFECMTPVITRILNELPECPETKILRAEVREISMSPVLRARDPLVVWEELTDLLYRVILYYHQQCFKGDSRVFKRTKPVLVEAVRNVDALVEIDPKNKTEERAMVLLRILKARPEDAISSKRAQDIIGGSEGKDVDPTVARRAMEFLGSHYGPSIVYEPFGKMYRIRTNFSQSDC